MAQGAGAYLAAPLEPAEDLAPGQKLRGLERHIPLLPESDVLHLVKVGEDFLLAVCPAQVGIAEAILAGRLPVDDMGAVKGASQGDPGITGSGLDEYPFERRVVEYLLVGDAVEADTAGVAQVLRGAYPVEVAGHFDQGVFRRLLDGVGDLGVDVVGELFLLPRGYVREEAFAVQIVVADEIFLAACQGDTIDDLHEGLVHYLSRLSAIGGEPHHLAGAEVAKIEEHRGAHVDKPDAVHETGDGVVLPDARYLVPPGPVKGLDLFVVLDVLERETTQHEWQGSVRLDLQRAASEAVNDHHGRFVEG